ncbi:MAG TPA: NUDIX domain-containing protein [Candidatus Acidoferrales bacterium]
MKRISSAGLLMFRRRPSELEILLVHPGGPFWRKKDLGAWSIPKGEYMEGETALGAAKREFEEETGIKPIGEFIPLDEIRQPSGKIITAWAFEGDCSPKEIRSNLFTMEWPPKSGKTQEFPEIDRAAWFSLEDARARILKGQLGFLDRLVARLQNMPDQKTNVSLS